MPEVVCEMGFVDQVLGPPVPPHLFEVTLSSFTR